MTSVIKQNNNILFYWLLYIVFLVILLRGIDKNKIILCVLLVMGIKPLRFICVFITCYILLLLGVTAIRPLLSSYIFNYHFKTTHNLQSLDTENPCIFVSNYPSPFYNYFISYLFPKNTVFAGKNGYMWGVHLISQEFYVLTGKDDFAEFQQFVKQNHKNHKNVFVFVERGGGSVDKNLYTVGKLRTGIFTIAKNLGIPIVPVAIGVIDNTMGIPDKYTHRITAGEPIIVEDVETTITDVSKFLNKNIRFKL